MNELTENEKAVLKKLTELKPDRLFVITDLPVPDSYQGIRTNDVLSLLEKLNEGNNSRGPRDN